MTVHDYPEIAVLRKVLTDHNLRMSLESDDDRPLPGAYRRIRVTLLLNKLVLSIPVDDECDDSLSGKPELMLHLVLRECEVYEETDDVLVWAAEGGFDASESRVRALYAEVGEVVPKFREIVGPDAKPLSSYDFEMNAGAAQALRAL